MSFLKYFWWTESVHLRKDCLIVFILRARIIIMWRAWGPAGSIAEAEECSLGGVLNIECEDDVKKKGNHWWWLAELGCVVTWWEWIWSTRVVPPFCYPLSLESPCSSITGCLQDKWCGRWYGRQRWAWRRLRPVGHQRNREHGPHSDALGKEVNDEVKWPQDSSTVSPLLTLTRSDRLAEKIWISRNNLPSYRIGSGRQDTTRRGFLDLITCVNTTGVHVF